MENTHANHILDDDDRPRPSARRHRRSGLCDCSPRCDGARARRRVVRRTLRHRRGILVNEIAPRPHNSGHCTIEAAAASQFEQQLRAVTGQPLGDGSCAPAAMAQLLGDLWDDGEPDWTAALARPGVHLHLYGKREARTGRKMGHLTVVGDDATDALQRVLDARAALNER